MSTNTTTNVDNSNVNSIAKSSNKPSTKPKIAKKKGTGPPLYQETAIKYYEGFMKSKRYNKGIKLSTGCAIFKTAWELPESNGLVLPSRVVRHFKQVLPKKPKTAKKSKNNSTAKANANAKAKSEANVTMTATTTSTSEVVSPQAEGLDDHDDDDDAQRRMLRSRTMVNMQVPKQLAAAALAEREKTKHEQLTQQQQRRTMVPVTGTVAYTRQQEVRAPATATLSDKIEDAVQLHREDEQVFDEALEKASESHGLGHVPKARSIDLNLNDFASAELMDDDDDADADESRRIEQLKQFKQNIDSQRQHVELEPEKKQIAISSSDTSTTPTPDVATPKLFEDHADITQDDLRPDTEELTAANNQYTRAETDIKHMDHDLVSFKAEIMKMKQEEQKKESKQDVEKENNKKKKKKKGTTAQILYAEDATKLFKKINDGKRFKNGLTLRKACNIFSVAWELPEENGRILPSKVQRHFKQVLPSKKTAKKTSVANSKSGNSNIKPSMAKSRTHRDNVTNDNKAKLSVQVDEEEEEKKDSHFKSQSMRGEATMNWKAVFSHSTHALNAVTAASSSSSGPVLSAPTLQPKQSMITQLEALIAADPHRSNDANEHEGGGKRKRERAGSMTDLAHITDAGNDEEIADDHVVEDDEIETLLKEVQRQKAAEKEEKLKEEQEQSKQQDAANAIDASLGK